MRSRSTLFYADGLMVIVVSVMLLLLSGLIGYRDTAIGTDTYNYTIIFNSIKDGTYTYRHEWGFILFTKLFVFLRVSPEVYLTAIAFFSSFFMMKAFWRFLDYRTASELYISTVLYLTALLFSSWYFVGVTNALRQAMALSVFFFSVTFLKERKYFAFFVWFCAAALFHKVIVLLLPFALLVSSRTFTLRSSALLFFLFALGYSTGLNEQFVKFLSTKLEIGIYEAIAEYGVTDTDLGAWRGFDVRFLMYNVFWYTLPLILLRLGYVRNVSGLVFVLKLYASLCVFYFIFGFGSFSNRWAYPGWLMIPILQACVLGALRVNVRIKLCAGFLFFVSLIFFLNRIGVF